MCRILRQFLLTIYLLFQMNTTFGGNYFEENKGQWNSDVLFKTHYAGGDVYICNDKIVYSLYDAVALNALHGSWRAST